MEALVLCGYEDLPMPKSKKHFDYSLLDVKAIRLMNRLAAYV